MECKFCKGIGTIEEFVQQSAYDAYVIKSDCKYCKGTGKLLIILEEN